MEHPSPSSIAWGILGAGVLAYEYFCPSGETLSEGLDDIAEHPVRKYFLQAAIGVTALHLTNLLPDKVDPIHQVGKLIRKNK